jgi:hypothetical protein
MKLALTAAAAVLAAVALPAGTEPTQAVERAFQNGGQVRLELTAAEYHITGVPDGKIRVSWWSSKPGAAEKARADLDVRGNTATVRTNGPHNGNLHFAIDVPERCDIDVDLSAGDISVRGIEGNKSLDMWAGDATIDVGRADLYRQVDASVRFGDISAQPFNVSKEGIFRSFSWKGSGKYIVKAHLFAGDLKLR